MLKELADTSLTERVLYRIVVSDGPSVLPAYTHMWAMNWRSARRRGERPTLRGYAGYLASRCRVGGPRELPGHYLGRALAWRPFRSG